MKRRTPQRFSGGGYVHCACRDCFEIAISSCCGEPALCNECEEARCDASGETACDACPDPRDADHLDVRTELHYRPTPTEPEGDDA